MLERTDAITKEVPEPIAFVLTYPTVLLLICSKCQPDYELMESKNVAVGMFYKVVFDGCSMFF